MFQSGLIWNFIDKVSCVWHVTSHLPLLILLSAHLGPRAGLVFMAFWEESPIQYVWLLATGLCGPHSRKPRSQFFWSCYILELYYPFSLILFVTAISTPFFREHFFSTSHLLAIYYYNMVKLQLQPQPQPYSHAVLHLFLLFSYPRLFCFILVYRLK